MGSSREYVVNLNVSSKKNSLQGGVTSEADTGTQSVSSSMRYLKQSAIQNRLATRAFSGAIANKRPMTANQRFNSLQTAKNTHNLKMQKSFDQTNHNAQVEAT